MFRCRAKVVIFMVVISILAVSTFLCNAIILIVVFFSKKLQNVQGIYRLSLAFADILVGLIVFPTFINTLYGHFIESYNVIMITNSSKYSINNGSAMPFEVVTIKGQLHAFRSLSRQYFNAVGFFTVLSLFVSVYSLVAASFDRFMAIYRPLKYNELKSIFAAKVATVTIWFSGMMFGILPLFIFNLRYQLVASIMISSSGSNALVLYGTVLFLPLVIMWVLIIATFVAARSTISRNHDKQKKLEEQMQLARTLGIMIGTFTFSLLPAIIIILLPHFLSNISLNRPSDLDLSAANLLTSLEMVAVIILTSNSLWNCFIYSTRDKKFRHACKQLFVRFGRMFETDGWKDIWSKRNRSVKPYQQKTPI